MPRFCFDLHDGETLVEDEEGLELADLHTASVEAQKGLADMIQDALSDGSQRTLMVRVREGTGAWCSKVPCRSSSRR